MPVKRTALIIAVLGLLALPAQASALWAGNLQVEASLTGIQYNLTVCGAKDRIVHFRALYGETGNEESYESNFYETQRYRCSDWELSEETNMWATTWDAEVHVYVHGRHAHTSDVEFRVE